MLFNSLNFLLFFPLVVGIYFIVPKKFRKVWLLIASYYFYMSWNPRYVILIMLSSVITFGCGLLVERFDGIKQKKFVLGINLLSNLGILVFFKYFQFIIDTMERSLSFLGLALPVNQLDILLPVGISFYTFQALSYTIDVYRGTVKAEHNFISYALYVSFFPQLVAGPIERSGSLLKQMNNIEKIKVWNYERVTEGLILMLWGYFQKMVIADRAAIFVNTVFNNYNIYDSGVLLLGAVAFAIQIYGDFAGYSTIAVGAAKVMGFSLMDNFDMPYFSESISEFWKKWHISLSSWLRDYIYIPLGGNRFGKAKKYRNLMITFFVSGLWHGAGWHFVIWGCIHGLYLVVGDLLKPVKKKINSLLRINSDRFVNKIGRVVVTFILVDIAWIFFRAGSLTIAFSYLKRLFSNSWFKVIYDYTIYECGLSQIQLRILLIGIITLLLASISQYIKKERFELILSEQPIWFRWLFVFYLLCMILIFGIYGPEYTQSEFIYFQF